jgi:YidC/Oxa1 family membrane protein insertase
MLYANPVALTSTVLSSFARVLTPIGGTVAAIVVLTIVVRLALHPLTRAAVRGERARASLAPQVAKLRKRHGSDYARLVEETQALYRKENISPYAGLLPTFIQLPVVFVLYRVFAHGGGVLTHAAVFGVPLGAHLLTAASGLAGLAVFGVVLVALAALAWANSRRAAMLSRASATPPMSGAVGAIGRVAPFLLPVSGVVLPLAAGVYLVTTTAWSLAENMLLRRGLP